MKKILVIIFSVIMTTLNLFAQSVPNSTNNGKSKIDNKGIDWNIFTNHPMRSLMDSAMYLSKDLYTIFATTENHKYWNDTNLLVNDLIRLNPLSDYRYAYSKANDEFERKKVERQILNDYEELKRKSYNSEFFIAYKMKLSEYSFTHKGFTFHPDQVLDFWSCYRQMLIEDDVDFAPLPKYIPMDEEVAKQFIRDNPSREVIVYGILNSLRLITDPQYIYFSKLKFIAITSISKNARQSVIAIYPNAESLSQRLEQLEIQASAEISETMFSTIYDGSYAITSSELNMIYDKLENKSRNRFVNLYNMCENYGFTSNLTVSAQKAVERNKQFVENQKRKYNGFPKIGVPYKGYQLYPRGLKKSIVIVFTKKDDYAYWGKCTYSNGKKSIIEVKVDANRVLPEIKIQFYIPTDDELD